MKRPDKIFLIGMPGSGKSTVARALAHLLQLPVDDLDDVLSEQEGKPITEIFAQDGEEAFRNYEAAALKPFLNRNEGFVLATGGGTPCFFNQHKKMNDSGVTVYLQTPLETLVARTAGNTARPLLAGDHQEKLAQLLAHRSKFYEQATLVVNTDGQSVEAIARSIKEQLAKR